MTDLRQGEALTVREMRARRRQLERVETKTKDLLDSAVVTTRNRAQQLAAEAADAEAQAAETLAAAVRVYGSATTASSIYGFPANEVEKAAKTVPVTRAREVADGFRQLAERKTVVRRQDHAQPPGPSAGGGPVAESQLG
ncbi:hypothetical protein GCM10010411_76300 [Actinomadura fulvescens]|uniref:Uncharacterized protein n=1 Tax=Actinomadura fulvescens TaxID=46160 RepID=A0ABN3QJC9_9ACTN